MVNLLIAIVIVIGGLWALRTLGNSQPAQVRSMMRKAAGAGLMITGAVLAMRGAMQIAGPVFALGLGLFTNVSSLFQGGAFWKKSEGQKSRVRTRFLEMELDHDTGAMDGTVLAGPCKGRKLSSLAMEELGQLHAQCASAGDQSAALFEAWLQRAHPEYAKDSGSRQAPGVSSGKMTREEALAVLGLRGNPAPDDIKTAHRNLMKQFHPDRGGTDYLASKINTAKDVLL